MCFGVFDKTSKVFGSQKKIEHKKKASQQNFWLKNLTDTGTIRIIWDYALNTIFQEINELQNLISLILKIAYKYQEDVDLLLIKPLFY